MRTDTVGPCLLVTPRSYLLDRMTPRVEEIWVPGATVGGGEVSYVLGEVVSKPPAQRRRARLLSLGGRASARRLEVTGVIIDLRRHNPQNWAHMLTNHLAYVFALAEATSVDWKDLILLLPANTPRHVVAAAAAFGLRTHLTDDPIRGEAIGFEAAPWTGNRGVRGDWARMPRVVSALETSVFMSEPEKPLPRRVFISRRDSRRLTNEAEIVAHLAAHNVTTLYAEDLAPKDQFRLLAKADLVVAIHGAALAPLLYRPPTAPPAAVVELLPVGHVTLVWRVLAQQVGCRWVGVRGRIEPKHIKGGLYDLERPFLRFSTDDFAIDPVSIDHALELLAENSENPESYL